MFNRVLNILTLIAAVAVLARIAQDYNPAVWHRAEVVSSPSKGSRLSLSNVNWSSYNKTLIMGLSVSCKYCSESMELYRKILHSERIGQINVIAIFPEQVAESRPYLRANGIEISDIRRDDLNELGIRRTPTLLLVDRAGRVQSTSIGNLSHARETE